MESKWLDAFLAQRECAVKIELSSQSPIVLSLSENPSTNHLYVDRFLAIQDDAKITTFLSRDVTGRCQQIKKSDSKRVH